WVGGTYETVEPPHKLSFTWAWDQEDGQPGDMSLVEIEFVAQDGATEMRFQHSGFRTAEIRDNHNLGWTSSFEDLESYINGEEA
ncbi:MAG: SRPBCC domain-containing protein, partial [Pseudomonadota bacterium]